MYKKGDILTVTVENMAFGGDGIAKVENEYGKLVIFIENTAPQEIVEIEIISLKRNLAKGKLLKIIQKSPDRIAPRCPHSGPVINSDGVINYFNEKGEINLEKNCGGCAWQYIDYFKQLEIKEKEVWDSLVRIGEIDEDYLNKIFHKIIPAQSPWFYRNKMDFSVVRDKKTGKRHFGLHMKGKFWQVTEIKECHLFRPWIKNFLQPMREFLTNLELKEGEIQSLVTRCGVNTGEVMINLIVENDQILWSHEFLQQVQKINYGDDKLTSVYITKIVNKKGQKKKFEEELLWGESIINEKLKLEDEQELNFEIAPSAFFQPNTHQAEKIYSLVKNLAELTGNEIIFDLFCGTGTIGLTLAGNSQKIIGVELNEFAVQNAKQNAELNNIKNTEYLVGDATKILKEMKKEADILVVDPPRAGLNNQIIELISSMKVKKVIYVSCNPTTLARDLKEFNRLGWRLDFVQAIDQFSHTYRIETVTRLIRN